MNDNTFFERYVAEAFDREGSGRPVPDAIHDDLITRAGRQRQWPTWLASVKEPPMRLSNSLAVGSPTVRVLATMSAALLLILAMTLVGVAGKSLLAADGTIVVDPEGNGDFTTIAEAVDAAKDGDTVVLRAGTYPESTEVTKALTIRGEDPETAIIEIAIGCSTDQATFETTCPPDVPMHPEHGPFGFWVQGVDVTVEDVHFHFGALASGVAIDGGSASLSGLSTGAEEGEGALMVHAGDGARVLVEDSDLGDGWVLARDGSQVTVERSALGSVFAEAPPDGDQHVVRDSQFTFGTLSRGKILVEGNDYTLAPELAQDSHVVIESGEGWVIRNNTLDGAQGVYGAIDIQAGAGPGTIEGNTFTSNRYGIVLSNDSVIRDNEFRDGEIGVKVDRSAPRLEGNTVEGMSQYGVNLWYSDPVLTGNRLCDSTTDLFIGSNSDPVIDDSNEICVTETAD
jgi:parallel beta-helix repeat protein